MTTHTTWSDWLINHASNDAGNRNLQAFSDVLGSDVNKGTKLQQVTKEVDTVILTANASNRIMLLHSPRNFGGTWTRPANKLVCMIGMGPQAVSILVNLNSALVNCNIIVPTVNKLSGCTTAQEVKDIPNRVEGVPGFEGSAIYIPGQIFQNAIITSNSTDPFDLIPLMNSMAKTFEAKAAEELATMNGNPINHADDINAWPYGVRRGTIPKTRYSVLPDDVKIAEFNAQRHLACIS
jgi:hypothetical protein